MPLPDANNYSMRIYELLKETDLENLSYAQFQGVAEKLFIEPENEDEMRRLVLVQLARMAVRGDWNGFLTGSSGIGGSIATDQVAFGSGTDAIEGNDNFKFTGSSVLELVNTLDIGGVGAAGIIKNSQSNQDLELKVTGTGNVRVKNETTNQASQLNIQGNGSGDPIISLSNDTKSVSLQCDTNQKLSVKGGSDEFVFDASSATGGITWPDGTIQTTAASGSGGSKYAANSLIKAPDQTTNNAYFPLNLSGYFLQGNTQVTNWNTTDTTAIRLIQALAPKAGTLDELAFRTGSTAGDTLYFAIYASDSNNMPTGDPIFTFNTGTTTANTQYEPTISVTVTEGQPLWIATFGQTNRTQIWTTYSGSTSVRAWPMTPRFLSSINYSNDQNQLTLNGLTNGVFPTLSSSTEFTSTLVTYQFKAAIHITET